MLRLANMSVEQVDEDGRPTGEAPTTNQVLEALKDEVMRQLKVSEDSIVVRKHFARDVADALVHQNPKGLCPLA